MANFADFSRSAFMGAQAGQQQASVNPLGQFIRDFTGEIRRRRMAREELSGEVTKIGMGEMLKAAYKQSTPKEKSQQWAWNEFQKGNRSPEILKSLGMYASPMDVLIAQSMGFGGNNEGSKNPPIIKKFKNKKTGEVFSAEYRDGKWQKITK